MSAPSLTPMLFDKLVRAALEEDLGRAGDITTLATIPAGTQAIAVMAARKAGVISGLPVAQETFRQIDPSLKFEILHADGSKVAAGTAVARISGEARSILTAERVALNFVSRMCGTATLTARHAELIAHTKAKVCCTRKTTPGLRALEKYAVRCGGGMNHRFGLDDAILIKDNHIAVSGSITAALRAAKAAIGHLVKIEIEIDHLDQLDEVLAEGADVVLLDNMTPDQMREAVRRIAGRMKTEASGGVRLDNIKEIAEAGVDLVSSGSITHSAPVLDIGLDIEIGRS
ncbi:MAG: carboxylating nicotinate-nucleotide diphosphorylase [Alphaproteobacteria bacterium]|nr:carboxylating nicotinate-nucleotide diphosphorylase [Alphaproteobacteria bacterium]